MTMKKSVLLPLTALCGGAAGYALRRWLFSAKDAEGLIARNHPASWLLLILCAGVLISFYLLTKNAGANGKYYDNFPTSYAGGLGAIAAAVGLFFIVLGSFIDRPDPITAISNTLGLLAVFSLGFTGYCRLAHRRPNFLFHTIICLYLALFQLSRYRSWISNPEMQEYAYELLATVCLMLAAYQRAAFDLNMGNRRAQQFWGLCAVFFSLICIAGTGSKLFYASFALWTVTNLSVLDPLPEPAAACEPSEEVQKEN